MNTKIREFRISLNMTKEQFAKVLGITLDLINQIENNEIKVSDKIIITIIEIFNIDIRSYNQCITSNDNLKNNHSAKNQINTIKSDIIKLILNIDDDLFFKLLNNVNELIHPETIRNVKENIGETELKLLSYENELYSEKKDGIL